MFGYAGKLLRVNLSEGRIIEEPLDPKRGRDYIGGSGYATHILYTEVPPPSNNLYALEVISAIQR